MNLIISTDIGHDPDDYFALCYLHSTGVNIRAILVSPGHKYQVAIAKMFCKRVGLNIPIGIAKETEVTQLYNKSFHQSMVRRYGYKLEEDGDGFSHEIIPDVLEEYPDSEVFIMGPLKGFGLYLMKTPDAKFKKVTMQGGFISYSAHNHDVVRLNKFEDKNAVPTFNLNGSKNEGIFLASEANIEDLRFVGKNVCHTILYNKERHKMIKTFDPKNIAQEMFIEGMDYYLLSMNKKEKKFHDPTAAVCHLHPEIGTWVQGTLYNSKGQWGTFPKSGTNTHVLADIDREKLWEYIRRCE